jgi:hypothetical protein
MAGEEKTGGAGGLRGEAEPAGSERRFDLDLGEACDQSSALQPFFEGPGGVLGRSRFDDDKARKVEAYLQEAWPVRASPVPRGLPRQAPQHEARLPRGPFGDHRQSEAKGGERIAIGFRFDLVQASLFQLAQGQLGSRSTDFPSPLVGEGRKGGKPRILSLRVTPLRSHLLICTSALCAT